MLFVGPPFSATVQKPLEPARHGGWAGRSHTVGSHRREPTPCPAPAPAGRTTVIGQQLRVPDWTKPGRAHHRGREGRGGGPAQTSASLSLRWVTLAMSWRAGLLKDTRGLSLLPPCPPQGQSTPHSSPDAEPLSGTASPPPPAPPSILPGQDTRHNRERGTPSFELRPVKTGAYSRATREPPISQVTKHQRTSQTCWTKAPALASARTPTQKDKVITARAPRTPTATSLHDTGTDKAHSAGVCVCNGSALPAPNTPSPQATHPQVSATSVSPWGSPAPSGPANRTPLPTHCPTHSRPSPLPHPTKHTLQ